MSDRSDRGITVTEIRAKDAPVDISFKTTAAFVGRTLRGPLDTPVLVASFGAFRRRFGDCWARSSLGPAVKQYFDNGGERLYVVRVANNARGAMLCLPANGSALILRAVEPGSTERIRAAIDYDGLGDGDEHRFNLTLQRLDPATGLINDQEFFQGLSYAEGDELFVADALQDSAIAHAVPPFPQRRPEQSVSGDSRYDLAWVEHAQDGSDGDSLSDYDLVGSRERRTGLFALEMVDHFDLLYLPPPGRHAEIGLAATVAAEIYCRRRGAMLVVDPPAAAGTTVEAIAAVRARGCASPNLVTYFPRVIVRDGEDRSPRAAGGAIAGLLAKLDRIAGPWAALDDGPALARGLEPSLKLDEAAALTLWRAGINALVPGGSRRSRVTGNVTLARGNESHRLFTTLSVRRSCLRILNSIDLATRWAVFERPADEYAGRLRQTIVDYLTTLHALGALESGNISVECEAGADESQNGISVHLAFQPLGSPGLLTFTLHQGAAGCRIASTAFAPAAAHVS